MSREATGENGAVLGSREYWSSINHATFLGKMMQNPSETNYHETLREVGNRANAAVDEIYNDLQDHINSIRAIPSEQRNALAKQVQLLYDVCSMSGVFCGRSSDCIGILSLSSFYLPGNSFRDEQAIQTAIHKITNHPDFFASECLDMIQTSVDWSISFSAGSDERKAAFLKDISQGKDEEFLRDVLNTYHSNDGTVDLRGRCGYSIGSSEYLKDIEWKVFAQDLPVMYSDNYSGALKGSLEDIARQLQQDLSQNEWKNNYIKDDTAHSLRAAVSDLERCGIITGISDGAIERLAWFVGGDAEKIRQMQSKLNDLGVGEGLEEDGVYGKRTETAVDKFIDKLSSNLTDLNKMRLLDLTIDAVFSALDDVVGSSVSIRKLHDAHEAIRQELQRVIWKAGAEHYLRPRGYDVAALLLEHSLEDSPSDLYFGQSHWVTQKIMQSNGFQTAYRELVKNMQSDPKKYATAGSIEMDFQQTGDTDLYYGIGRCSIAYTCTRTSSVVQVNFSIEDEFNFDELRLISGDVEHFIKFNFSLGNLANDAGLLSQADFVMSSYKSYISFQKTIAI